MIKQYIKTFESYFYDFSILEQNIEAKLITDYSINRVFANFVITKIYGCDEILKVKYRANDENTQDENFNEIASWVISNLTALWINAFNQSQLITNKISEKINFYLLFSICDHDFNFAFDNKDNESMKNPEIIKVLIDKLEYKIGGQIESVVKYYLNNIDEPGLLEYITNLPYFDVIKKINSGIVFKPTKVIREDEKNGKIIIKFPDGFYWIDLNDSKSKEEEKYMHHCGDTRTREESNKNPEKLGTMFSLRNQYSQSFITATIDKDTRTFSQCKGKNNKKPDKKYFSYIVELLKSEYVENIVPSIYEPQKNFTIKDLPFNVQEEIKQTVNVQE